MPSAAMPHDIEHRLDRVRSSTARFTAALDAAGLSGADLRMPSLLAGWTRAHVLTHVARSADAVRRIVEAAQLGEQAAMYPGGDAGRSADIEAGAGREPAELLADLAHSAEALDKSWSTLEPAVWAFEVVHRRLGAMPLWRLISMRWREVEIHWVDLDLGYGPADWPAEFVTPLLPALAAPEKLGPRLPAGVAVRIEATDTGREFTVGSGEAVRLRAPSWALAAWLVGRPEAVRAALPDPPALTAWL